MIIASQSPDSANTSFSERAQEKRRDLSLLILYLVSPNTIVEMNKNIATPRQYVIAMRRGAGMQKYIQVGVTYPLSFDCEIGDFGIKDKAWNAFLTSGFSRLPCKVKEKKRNSKAKRKKSRAKATQSDKGSARKLSAQTRKTVWAERKNYLPRPSKEVGEGVFSTLCHPSAHLGLRSLKMQRSAASRAYLYYYSMCPKKDTPRIFFFEAAILFS